VTTFDNTALDELAYNFDSWLEHRPELKKGRQVIPEPSGDSVTDFLRGWAEVTNRALNGVDYRKAPEDREESKEERDERVSENLAREGAALNDLRTERMVLVAQLCQDTPDFETLQALPHRVFGAFTGYLRGKLQDPEQ